MGSICFGCSEERKRFLISGRIQLSQVQLGVERGVGGLVE